MLKSINAVLRLVIKSPVHIGHVHGWENRRLLKAAKELGMTQKQLNDYVNDPARTQRLFHLENARDNVSHRNEKQGSGELDDIKKVGSQVVFHLNGKLIFMN